MISSEVHRTLVKSPPELWAELGDPASLARHLGELGEIRITRIDPEQAVEWETEDSTGKVLIKPSAWGTKVTLTVTRASPQAEPAAEVEPEPAAEVEPEPAEVEATAAAEPAPEIEPEPEARPEPAPWAVETPSAAPQSEPTLQTEGVARPELLPRRGFFSRLFGRRPREISVEPQPAEPQPADGFEPAATFEPVATSEPEPAATSEPEPVEPLEPKPAEPFEPLATVEPEPVESPVPHEPLAEQTEQPAISADVPEPELPAGLEEGAEAAEGEVTAVLTAVLDRLGAAHHRPFSRG